MRGRFALAVAGAVMGAGFLVGSAVPALASTGPHAGVGGESRTGAQVVLSGHVDVPRGQSSGDVVVFHGDASVEGTVRGSVVVFDGDLFVSGEIRGDVVDFRGQVRLAAGAHVTGDVWVGRGRADVDPAATVDGHLRTGAPFRWLGPSALLTRFLVWLAITVSTLVLGLLLLLLAPRAADSVFEAARTAAGASVGWGFIITFGLPVVAILALLTLVGIPLGVGLLLALALLYSVGYVWSAWIVGRALARPGRQGEPRRIVAFLAGWAILRLVGLIPFVGGITWLAGSLFGLGAMTVAMWRARRGPAVASAGVAGSAGVPPPPPAPAPPLSPPPG